MAWKYFGRGKATKTSQAEVVSPLTHQPPVSSSVQEPDQPHGIPDLHVEALPQDVRLVSTFPKDPILSEDDQVFLQRIASNFQVPPLPSGKTVISDAGEAIDVYGGADQVPLPMSPGEDEHARFPNMSSDTTPPSWTAKYWAFVPDRVIAAAPNMTMPQLSQLPQLSELTQRAHLPNMPQFSMFGRKTPNKVCNNVCYPDIYQLTRRQTSERPSDTESSPPVEHMVIDAEKSDDEENKEARDLSMILSNLNLSAINNRVIGVSKDSQRLLESFTIILKDIINGAPTAYDDLEKLLTDRQAQLDKMYNSLPPFLQSLVQSVPTKISAFLAPQLVAAMTKAQERKAGAANTMGTKNTQKPPTKSTQKRKMTSYIPSLRSLVTQKGAVAAMLRSIISFLELRFPLLLAGTNVIMSLAVFCRYYPAFF